MAPRHIAVFRSRNNRPEPRIRPSFKAQAGLTARAMTKRDSHLFHVEAAEDGAATLFTVSLNGGEPRRYRVRGGEQGDYSDFYRELCGHFGTRVPHLYQEPEDAAADGLVWRPLITENLSPKILAGYGDPAVLKTDEGWILVATSNDAPGSSMPVFPW